MNDVAIGSINLAEVVRVYAGSDGDATKALYARLAPLGAAGDVATNLLRACKSSERAKVYRGRRYRGAAYDRKQWSIENLCQALGAHGGPLGIAWGWDEDQAAPVYRHVLYVELPTGQVSFHSPARGDGPDYQKPWDGVRGQSSDRIIRFVARLLDGAEGMQA